MPVVFDNSFVHDTNISQTVERSFRVYGSWAGIHSFDFRSTLEDDSVVVSGTQLLGNVPMDVELSYTVEEKEHGAVLRYVDEDHYLRINTTDDDFIEVWEADTLVRKLPVSLPSAGDVRIAFREQRYSSDESDVWQSVSMWMNDRLLFTWTWYTGAVVEDAVQCGLYGNTTFTNVRVPQLTEFAEWSSVDPGETPAGGLNRAIEGRYCKFYVRYDGTLRAWRAAATDAVMEYEENTSYQTSKRVDRRAMATHVRMLGAYAQAEFIRHDLVRSLGYRFVEAQNPYIMTTEACFREAQREMQRMEEQYQTGGLSTEFCPFLEPEDRITSPSGDHIINKLEWQAEMGGRIRQSVDYRSYTFGA